MQDRISSAMSFDKQQLRDEIARQVDEFLRGGGRVEFIDAGNSGGRFLTSAGPLPAQSALADRLTYE